MRQDKIIKLEKHWMVMLVYPLGLRGCCSSMKYEEALSDVKSVELFSY